MKFTEGGFRNWAYEVAREYPTFTKLEYDEIKNERGRYSYKIFNSPSIAAAYTNNHKVCLNEKPLYQRERFKRYPNAEIRRLTSHEVDIYLKEQNETK